MRRRKNRFRLAMIAFAYCMASPALAETWDLVFRPCLPPTVEIPEEVFPQLSPIPVGCKVIDCCPGCPAGGPIDWQVRLSGDLVQSVELEFENISKEELQNIAIKGSVERIGTNRFRISRGTANLRGLPRPTTQQKAQAVPLMIFDQAIAKKLSEVAATASVPDQQDVSRVEFVLAQRLGQTVVNEFSVLYRIKFCPKLPLPGSDRIAFTNHVIGSNVAAIHKGRRGTGCPGLEVQRGINIIDVGDMRSNGPCAAEATVFPYDKAVQLINPVTAWSDSLGDVLTVDLKQDRLQMPVVIYILRDPLNETIEQAKMDLDRADSLYNTMGCGLGFNFDTLRIEDKRNEAQRGFLLKTSCEFVGGPGVLYSLIGEIGYDPNALNVYYIQNHDSVPEWKGENCEKFGYPNMVLVSPSSDSETLAHELGHAFSLDHPNELGIDLLHNIMNSPGENRTSFTKGQCFRCNIDGDSFVVTSGIRAGSGVRGAAESRPCPNNVTDDRCPALATD